ncbi:GNAT family N-acetyltransferase [Streptomyces sp. NPDC002553]|uniref:GNAT family N-acetyltransferase n=1 Tax=Streptomyces sp. NPDC002553 TaxID=3154417 RepID=UPI0033322C9C
MGPPAHADSLRHSAASGGPGRPVPVDAAGPHTPPESRRSTGRPRRPTSYCPGEKVLEHCAPFEFITTLTLDARPVAAQLCLRHKDRVYSVITAMDPTPRDLAPGYAAQPEQQALLQGGLRRGVDHHPHLHRPPERPPPRAAARRSRGPGGGGPALSVCVRTPRGGPARGNAAPDAAT